ncbi:MAG TPA: aldehyde dehydrogenase family protein [Blastocatellia bacterium]|nr:aldehyde dehydrogenase family protein [Blastocatellia bacterium]
MSALPAIGDDVMNLISGSWEAAASERWNRRYDPANQQVLVARAPDSSRDDARRAIEAAADAGPAWRQWTAPKRGRLLFDWLNWIDSNRAALAELLTREEGKTRVESAGEVARAIDVLEYTAGMGRRLGGKVFSAEDSSVFCYSSRHPLGVVGLISPWNFPVAIPVWKIAPALIAGNTVVLKPSPLTPLTAVALVRGLESVGLPAGVVNLVHGDSEPGIEMTSNSAVNGLSFTGSTKVGKLIARAASERLLKVQLELGGKNPQIVLEDADLDMALAGVIAGAFGSTGQRCTATSRAIILDGVYQKFVARLVEQANQLIVGPGVQPGVQMGPLVTGNALDCVTAYTGAAKNEGAEFLAGGDRLRDSTREHGFFFAPTVVEAEPEMAVAMEEVFGPVLSVIRARDFEHAMEIANTVRYGLTASIFTRDVNRALSFADRIEAGMVHVNRPGVGGYSHAPFGGIKDSGYGGREVGDEVMNFYTEPKVVYVNYE